MFLHLKLLTFTTFALSLVPQLAFSLDDPLEQSNAHLYTTIQDSVISKPAPLFKKRYTYIRKQKDLHRVARKVSRFLKDETNPVNPDEIVVILDVDGTLTDHSQPGKHLVKPRYNSTDIVRKLIDQHVNVIISSAWHVFDETKDRLKALGLAEDLGLDDKTSVKLGSLSVNGASFDYIQQGKVVSVKNAPFSDSIYYRQKALAPYVLGLGNDIKKIIFADDSSANIQIFKRDIKKYNLYPNASQVFMVNLTTIDGMDNIKKSIKNKKRKIRHIKKTKLPEVTHHLTDSKAKAKVRLVRENTPYSKMLKIVESKENSAHQESRVKKMATFFESKESSLPYTLTKRPSLSNLNVNVKELREQFEKQK